jgi:hypothetical protein
VIGQVYNREIRIFAAFCSEGMSVRQHLLEYTGGWLSTNARQLRMMSGYEEVDSEIQSETFMAIREILGGESALITKPWEVRKDAMLDTLTKAQPFTFKPIVQITPENTAPLSQALNSGRYSERVQADRKNYHVVNAFSILLARLEIYRAMPKKPGPHRIPPSAMSA